MSALDDARTAVPVLPLLPGAREDVLALVDERTREILEHRKRTAIVRRRGWLVRRALAVADMVGLVAAFLVAQLMFGEQGGASDAVALQFELVLFLLTLPGWIVVAKLYGLYDRDEERTDHSTADDVIGVFHMLSIGTWVLFAGAWVTGWADPQLSKLVAFWALGVVAVPTARAASRAWCRRQVSYLQNTIIVGAGDVGQTIALKLTNHPEYGINLVGFVDDRPKEQRADLPGHLTVLGGEQSLQTLIELFDVERVIVAFSVADHNRTLQIIQGLRDSDVQVDIVPRLFEVVGPGATFHMIEGLPVISVPRTSLTQSSRFVKRALDLTLTIPGLLVLSPLLLAIALVIRLDSRGPIFYRHARVGLNGRPIRVMKFRSMRAEVCRGDEYGGAAAEAAFQNLLADPERRDEFARTYKLHDDPRVTRVGRLLRKTSLDELPQLFNVVRGDLSLVGPRPLVEAELSEYYGQTAERLLKVTPGITGYWQINGRSALSYEDRVRLDLSYVADWSLSLDLRILAKTLRVLASRAGAV